MYEIIIIFFTNLIKGNHAKENIHGGTAEARQKGNENLQHSLCLPLWVLAIVPTPFPKANYLCLFIWIHSLIKNEDVLLFPQPLESNAAPTWLIISGQCQELVAGKPHGVPQQLMFSSSISWHQTPIFSSTQRKGVLLTRRAFDGSVIDSASTGLLHRLKATQAFRKPLFLSHKTLSLAF